MRVIILAAGQAVQLDGYNKLLIKDPVTKKTILDMYLEAFKGHDITVVLGYRAINVMHEYSNLDYVYNSDWAISNSSHSLSLALNEEPCFVISGDLFIDPEIIAAIDNAGPNIVASIKRDSRTLNALNISHDVNQNVYEIYQGKLKNVNDPEAIGIYKISSKSILKSWRTNCLKHIAGLKFANNLSSFLNFNKALSGFFWNSRLSHFGPPTAPSITTSHSKAL